jgi:hypothetical protein
VEARGKNDTFAVLLSPMTKAIEGRPLLAVGTDQIEDLRNGKALPAGDEMPDSELVGLIGLDGELAALARCRAGRLHPFKVLIGSM